MSTIGKIILGMLGLATAVIVLLTGLTQYKRATIETSPTLEYVLLTPTPRATLDCSGMPTDNQFDTYVDINEVALELDRRGMWIHMKLTIHNLRGDKFRAGVIFFQDDASIPVKSLDDSYRFDGRLANWTNREDIPSAEVTFPDVRVFIPYSAFDLQEGTHRLGYQVQAYYYTPQSHGPISSILYYFSFTRNRNNIVTVIPEPTPQPIFAHSSQFQLNTTSCTPTP